MKKILMRMGKDPFKALSAEETLKTNALGTNIGNSLFQVASHKLLTSKSTEVIAYKFTPSMKDVDWVNKNFDCFVIPLANAFRVSFKKHLDKHTEFINKLTIPVVILGVGVQANLNCSDFSHLITIEKSVKNFCNAVLKKSSSIGVRGECTKKYLLSLGYKESQIDIIGCPSMFWHGNQIYTYKKVSNIYKDSKISFNLSPYAEYSDILLKKVVENFNNLTYIPQNNTDLEQLMYSGYIKNAPKKIDKLINEHFYKENKIVFFVEPKKWLDFLSTCEFAIGTRIHGTIANLIAGTPAHIFVHDSRTKELAEYFEIPFSDINDIKNINIKDIYVNSDYSGIVLNHKKRFDTIISFLEKHNLENIFKEENKEILEDYENKYISTNFKQNVRSLDFATKNILGNRVKNLYSEIKLLKEKK